jgi:hypothetical protein
MSKLSVLKILVSGLIATIAPLSISSSSLAELATAPGLIKLAPPLDQPHFADHILLVEDAPQSAFATDVSELPLIRKDSWDEASDDLLNSIAQEPAAPEPLRTPAVGGDVPGLKTQPSTPEEPPFKPQKVPLQKPESFLSTGSAPATTILTPSAYGQVVRSFGVGLGFQSRTRFSNKPDGSLGFGFGLGDPRKGIGLDIGITTFSSFRQGFFEIGGISFKINRALPADFVIAVGTQNLLTWGGVDTSPSPYAVVTKKFRLRDDQDTPLSQLYVSAGVGGGQFRSESDVDRGTGSVGAFGSIALRVVRPINLITEWSGQDLTVGLSIAPLRKTPIIITPAVTDITGNAGDGSRFILSFGYGLRY